MRLLPSVAVGALALSAILLTAPDARAQIRASEPTSLTQTIDGTEFRIEYYRPRARGRSPLFGIDAVVWEHVWTPGANWATKMAFQKPIEFEGVSIDPGVYSIWIEMDDQMMPHELIFEPDTLIFHTTPPADEGDQVRFPVEMEDDAPFKELLTWDFEDISSTGGKLALRWGTHRMSWDVKVEPSMRQTTTPEEAGPVVGAYQVEVVVPRGAPAPPTFRVTITHDEAGILHADWDGVPAQGGGGEDEWFNALDMWMLPGGAEGWFVPGESYEPGVLRETWAGYYFEFELGDGPSPSFVLRDEFDEPFFRGTRVN